MYNVSLIIRNIFMISTLYFYMLLLMFWVNELKPHTFKSSFLFDFTNEHIPTISWCKQSTSNHISWGEWSYKMDTPLETYEIIIMLTCINLKDMVRSPHDKRFLKFSLEIIIMQSKSHPRSKEVFPSRGYNNTPTKKGIYSNFLQDVFITLI